MVETLLLWIIAFTLATWMFGVLGSAVLLVLGVVVLMGKAVEDLYWRRRARPWVLGLLVIAVACAVVAVVKVLDGVDLLT